MRGLFEHAPAPTFLVTVAGSLIYANRAFGDLLGYEPDEPIGLRIGDIVHAEDDASLGARISGVFAGTAPAFGGEMRYLRKNGETVWVQASVSRWRGDRERSPLLLVQAIDIDGHKRTETALAEIENRCDFVLESAGQGFWDRDFVTGRDYCSPAWKQMRGFDPSDEVFGGFEGWLTRVHPDDQGAINHEVRTRRALARTVGTSEHRELHADGRWLRIRTRRKIIAWLPNGEPARMIGTDTDVTDLRQAEEKLEFANTLLRTEMDASPDGILVVDANKRIISFNRRFARMWKLPDDLLDKQDDAPVLAAVTAAMKDPEAFIARVRYLYAHPEEESHDELDTVDGRSIDRHTEVLQTPAGEHLGRVWFFRDITERKRAEAQILRMARCDALTGLANRVVFMEAIQRAIASFKRGGKAFAVLCLDINQFKDVNDTLGHPIGDELIKAVAQRLRSNIREVDVVARFGGDEFAVLLTDTDRPREAAVVANALAKAMKEPFHIETYDIRSGVSIGISLYRSDEPNPETMLSRADVALYLAKARGNAGYRFHTSAMDTEIRTRVTLDSELREGIPAGQLFLVYQPQVEIATGRVTGVEALVRWRHPTRGVLAPSLFIPIAEKSGLVATLGHWVMREACRQAKAWSDAGRATGVVAVNLSGVQFKRAFELEKEIKAILAETGVPPCQIELELTETVLMVASRASNGVLDRLRQCGMKLAIDDFGVGYSSLDYLRRFPVDRIKIAQVFVGRIDVEAGSAAIVKATIGLARELGIAVIAEGVETLAQLELLQSWGCREAQGYYFAKPLEVEEVTALLGRGVIARGRELLAKSAA